MKSISKLKDEARKHEQREEWEKAIQAYLQVLRVADEEEAEVELPLYNRLGDLCVRLGRPDEAVRHYEQAADRYAEAGLYNNAIALCNKALRYSPDRLELIRKLGQFSALQGFITDARRYFLDYAERQFNAGNVDDALTALEDFANVADDADVREMLGRRMHAHGRTAAAVAELQRAYAMRVQAGETERANALRSELQAMDPNAIIENAPADAPARAAAPTVHDLPGYMEPESELPAAVEDESRDTAPFADVAADQAGSIDASGIEIDGLESAHDTARAADMGMQDIEGLETTAFDFDSVDAGSVQDLGITRDEASFDEADVYSLPDEPGDESFDLPLLDDDPFGDAGPASADNVEYGPIEAVPDSGPAPLDLGTSFSFELPSSASGSPPPAASTDATFDLPLVPETDDTSSLTGRAGADDDGIDLPAFDGPDDFDASPPAWEPESGPTFDTPAFETDEAPFELPAPDEPDTGTIFDLPTLDEPDTAADADLATHVEPAASTPAPAHEGFELPEVEADTAFELPEVEEPDTAFELPEEEPDMAFELPELEEPYAAFELEEPETPFDLPQLEEPETPFDLPELEVDSAPDVPEREAADTTFDAAVGHEPVAEARDAVSAAPGAEPHSVPEAGATDPPHVPVEIPAIELPTWDMEPGPGGGNAPAEAEQAAAADWPEIAEVDSHTSSGAAEGVAWLDELDEPAPAEALESAWLDEMAGDAAAAGTQDFAMPDDAFGGGDEPDEATPYETGSMEGIGERAAADATPAVEDVAQAAQSAAAAAREMKAHAQDEYIDLGALLAEDAEEESTRFRIQETAPTGDEERDFAELLNQFKSKVHEHLPPEDAAAHYDLGLAFKEMGLIDEAIGEFQIALRAGHMRLRVYEELGGCFLMKEQYNIAEKVLTSALEMKFEDELELLGVYYHLGRAYEALGRRDQARDAYERVLGMDINFEDVTDRLARL